MSLSLDLSTDFISKLTKVATLAALHAGEILKKGFVSSYNCFFKEGSHNLVTDYDIETEKAIITFIKKEFPDHEFLGEEGTCKETKSHRIKWIIDPIDGTVNFAHRIPFFCISIAATLSETTLCGVVFNPMTQELFIGEKNQGSYLNGNRLQVSKTTLLEESILATGFPYNTEENPGHCIEKFIDFIKLGIPIRRLGSAALDLAYVAAGRFDGFWEISLQPWDFAAGMLLVEEAGGKVTDYKNQPLKVNAPSAVLASNSHIHSQMLPLLTQSK